MQTEVAKSQWVRAYNVSVMCPWMISMSRRYKMTGAARYFMEHGSWATLAYNLKNIITDYKKPQEPYNKIPLSMSTVYEHPTHVKIMGNIQRLLDVFIYAPFCFYVARKYKLKPVDNLFLWYTGISTIWLNGLNYLANRKRNGS